MKRLALQAQMTFIYFPSKLNRLVHQTLNQVRQLREVRPRIEHQHRAKLSDQILDFIKKLRQC